MTPFIGQLMLVSFNFPPKNWQFCSGAILPIASNQALFALLGTNFGGNGQTTFGLPDLRGRSPMGTGAQTSLGQRGGEEFHTLSTNEMPAHDHFLMGTAQNADGSAQPGGGTFATTVGNPAPPVYNSAKPSVPMSANMVSFVGQNQPHENRQPFLTLNWIISMSGIFPSRD